MVLQFQLPILTNPGSEVTEKSNTERIILAGKQALPVWGEWLEHYNTRKWFLKGLLIQIMKMDLESRRLQKRLSDDQWTKHARLSLHCQTVVMSNLDKGEKMKAGESNLPYYHALRGRLCPGATLKAEVQLLLEREPVYTYFVHVKVKEKLRNRSQLYFKVSS